MRSGIVVADSSPIFSLAIIDRLDLLIQIFEYVKIPEAVWFEITQNKSTNHYNIIYNFFEDKVHKIIAHNELTNVMDLGESESVILYQELNANFLLIDDKKARLLAEKYGVNCIGTVGLLSYSKDIGLVKKLKPLFENLLKNKRYYSLNLLNKILKQYHEDSID